MEQVIKSVSQIIRVNNLPSIICVTQSLANEMYLYNTLALFGERERERVRKGFIFARGFWGWHGRMAT